MDIIEQIEEYIENVERKQKEQLVKTERKCRENRKKIQMLEECDTVATFVSLKPEKLELLIAKEDQNAWNLIRQFHFLEKTFGKENAERIPQYQKTYAGIFKLLQTLKNDLNEDVYQREKEEFDQKHERYLSLLEKLKKEKIIDNMEELNLLKSILINIEYPNKIEFLLDILDRNIRLYRSEKKNEFSKRVLYITKRAVKTPLKEDTEEEFLLSDEDLNLIKETQKYVNKEELMLDTFLEGILESLSDYGVEDQQRALKYGLQKSLFDISEAMEILEVVYDREILIRLKEDMKDLKKYYQQYQTLVNKKEEQEIKQTTNEEEKKVIYLSDEALRPYLGIDLEKENDKDFTKRVRKMINQLSKDAINVSEKKLYGQEYFKKYGVLVYREFMKEGMADIAYVHVPGSILILGATKLQKNIKNTKKIESLISTRIQSDHYKKFVELCKTKGNDQAFIDENHRLVEAIYDEKLKGGKEI